MKIFSRINGRSKGNINSLREFRSELSEFTMAILLSANSPGAPDVLSDFRQKAFYSEHIQAI